MAKRARLLLLFGLLVQAGCELKERPQGAYFCPDGRRLDFSPETRTEGVIPPTNYFVASEFVHYQMVEEYLPLCKKYGLTLVLALYPELLGSAPLENLLRKATAEGVPVIAWPLLPMEDDYWPNEFNAAKFADLVERYIVWFECADIKVRWFLVDLEMPDWLSSQMGEVLSSGGGSEQMQAMLESQINPDEFEQSESTYNRMIWKWRDKGYHFAAVTYPFIIDDLADGDRDMQDLLAVPTTGVDYEYFGFMAYRSGMYELFGQEVNAWFSYTYAKKILETYGDKGITGFGVVGFPDYREPAILMEDIAAARAAGLDKFVIYSMDMIMVDPDPEAWLDFASVTPVIPEKDDAIENLRLGLVVVDIMCDEYH